MKTAVIAAVLAVSALASAEPAKIGDHTLDFKQPAKFKPSLSTEKGVWIGEFSSDKPDQHIVVTAVPHKLEDGPVDIAKQIPKLDAQMAGSDMKPDNDATAVAADGFGGMSRHYITTDPKKPLWGIGAFVDAGPVIIVVFAAGRAAPNDLTKTTLALLASITVDGKKGPAAYAKK